MNGGFGVDVKVPWFEDGLGQGADSLAGLGDVVVDVDAVVEFFL